MLSNSASTHSGVLLERLMVGGKDLIHGGETLYLKTWNQTLAVEAPMGVVKTGRPQVFFITSSKITEIECLVSYLVGFVIYLTLQ